MRILRAAFWTVQHPLVLVYLIPALIAGGILLAVFGPEWWGDFFFDHLFAVLLSVWIGAGFATMWWMVRKGSSELGSGMQAAIGVAGAVVLVVLFGVPFLVADPWIIGVAIVPGLAMAEPWLRRHVLGEGEEATAGRAT